MADCRPSAMRMLLLLLMLAVFAVCSDAAKRKPKPVVAAAEDADEPLDMRPAETSNQGGQPAGQQQQQQQQAQPPWARKEPPQEEEVFMWTDSAAGKRDWANAISYREWQRWATFLNYRSNDMEEEDSEEDDDSALVPLRLETFPRKIWDEVLQLCNQFQHDCQLDSAVGDLSELKRRCANCLASTACTVDNADKCHPVYCERCLRDQSVLLKRLGDPNRKVTARVTRRAPVAAKK